MAATSVCMSQHVSTAVWLIRIQLRAAQQEKNVGEEKFWGNLSGEAGKREKKSLTHHKRNSGLGQIGLRGPETAGPVAHDPETDRVRVRPSPSTFQ